MAYMQRGYLTRLLNRDDNIYMLGPVGASIPSNQLPTNRDILKYFFSLVKEGNILPLESARLVALDVQNRWNNQGIPPQPCSSISVLLIKLVKDWDEVQRNRNGRSEEQQFTRLEFERKLGEVFNVLQEEEDSVEWQERNRWYMPAPAPIRRISTETGNFIDIYSLISYDLFRLLLYVFMM